MHPEAAKAVKDASLRHMRDFTRLSDHAVAAMHPITKFTAIRAIVMDVERRFPDPKRDEIPLDESVLSEEIGVLMKISDTIRPSDEYQEMIKHITKKTVCDLMSRKDQKSRILRWGNLSYGERNHTIVTLHHTMMMHAQDEFSSIPFFSKRLTPVKITPFFEAAAKHTKAGRPLGISYGYAHAVNDPDGYEIYYNQHPDAEFDNVFEAIDTDCHETAHIIESHLAWFFNTVPDQVPAQLQKDARNFSAQRAASGYIPSRIPTPYQYQCNEFVAFSAGYTARKILSLLIP